MRKLTILSLFLVALPVFSQDVKTTILKHLKTSRDFTLQVAEAMPAASYDFKLTAPQMSFAEQMVHLSEDLDYFISPFYSEKPNNPKPVSLSKPDVIAYEKAAFDRAIERVSALTVEQIHKPSYASDEGPRSGLDLLLGLLDHTTHHRASAEMYLRAKGIMPPEYQF
jgi:uncharacterized damage-inducible protein DinB